MSMMKDTLGEGNQNFVLNRPFTTTAALTSGVVDTRDKDAFSLQLIVDFQQDEINVDDGVDAVVASTGVWTFTNYTFTDKVGAMLVVSGAENPGNNGTFPISAVSTDTATTATTGLVNETFGPNVVVFVIRSETASVPEGAWTISATNDYVPPAAISSSGSYGAPAQVAHLSDITALFSKPTTIQAVTTASSQYVQADPHFDGRGMVIIFTPSAGLGTAKVAIFFKNWSR